MAQPVSIPYPARVYLDNGYSSVPGMSSLFAAGIIVRLLERQTVGGIRGNVVEIGVFEGRLFIAMALSLSDKEKALAIDHFAWPNEGVRKRFEQNCAFHGVPASSMVIHQGDSRKIAPSDLIALIGKTVRLFHIDGEHTAEHLTNDMMLAVATVADDGIIVLDDMLHPGYPNLAVIVHAFLSSNPEWRVFAIIDRENIIGAAKYLLSRVSRVFWYVTILRSEFGQYVWPMAADFGDYHALVLTLDPKMPIFK